MVWRNTREHWQVRISNAYGGLGGGQQSEGLRGRGESGGLGGGRDNSENRGGGGAPATTCSPLLPMK